MKSFLRIVFLLVLISGLAFGSIKRRSEGDVEKSNKKRASELDCVDNEMTSLSHLVQSLDHAKSEVIEVGVSKNFEFEWMHCISTDTNWASLHHKRHIGPNPMAMSLMLDGRTLYVKVHYTNAPHYVLYRDVLGQSRWIKIWGSGTYTLPNASAAFYVAVSEDVEESLLGELGIYVENFVRAADRGLDFSLIEEIDAIMKLQSNHLQQMSVE